MYYLVIVKWSPCVSHTNGVHVFHKSDERESPCVSHEMLGSFFLSGMSWSHSFFLRVVVAAHVNKPEEKSHCEISVGRGDRVPPDLL